MVLHDLSLFNSSFFFTTDADKALADNSYKKVYRQSMAKASAIWNHTRSTKAADAAFDIVGCRFSVPCVTRWNSYYVSVKTLIAHDDKLSEVCKSLGLPPFIQLELNFLKEYVSLMGPVAQSIDMLQGDQNCGLGYVLPTITTLRKKINQTELKYARSMQQSLLKGNDNRFGQYFHDKEFLLAAVTNPRFKLSWVDDSTGTLRNNCADLLEQGKPTTL